MTARQESGAGLFQWTGNTNGGQCSVNHFTWTTGTFTTPSTFSETCADDASRNWVLTDLTASTDITTRLANGSGIGTYTATNVFIEIIFTVPDGDVIGPDGSYDKFLKSTRLGGEPFPDPEMPVKCKEVGRLDWLTPGANVGARNVTVEDNRREAALAVNYVIAWGDGTGNVYSKLPATHTYAEPGLYRITMRVQYRDGSIQIFATLINVDGNGCSLQMFIDEWLFLLVGIIGLLFLAAIIVQASKLKKNPKRKLRLLFLGTLVAFAIFIGIVLTYAYLIKVPA